MGTSTIELDKRMRAIFVHVPTSITQFCGVFPSDRLPPDFLQSSLCSASSYVPFSVACIANTDPSNLPGQHWVAFYIDRSRSPPIFEFFDSYGLTPSDYNFPTISPNAHLIHNPIALQSLTSTVCGQYCILYLYLRTLFAMSAPKISNQPLIQISDKILNLAPSPTQRDRIVRQIVNHLPQPSIHFTPHLSLSLPTFTGTSILPSVSANQSCRPFNMH